MESPLTWCDEVTDSYVDAFSKIGLLVGCVLFWLFLLVQCVESCISWAALYYILLFLNSVVLEVLPQDFIWVTGRWLNPM